MRWGRRESRFGLGGLGFFLALTVRLVIDAFLMEA